MQIKKIEKERIIAIALIVLLIVSMASFGIGLLLGSGLAYHDGYEKGFDAAMSFVSVVK